jgi:SAM-dependent methyltransferase
MTTIGTSQERWQHAQSTELSYWQGMSLGELVQICGDLRGFLERLGQARLARLFDAKEVLEIGCGPLGLSLGCFYQDKRKIRRLVKVEPLPQVKLDQTPAAAASWALPFVSWVAGLASEGDYVRKAGEELGFAAEFDTAVIYNVIDHVQNPRAVVHSAFAALRGGGTLLLVVDCMSVLGRMKFEHYTRRRARGSILVDAHPHSFRARQVEVLLREVGFIEIECLEPLGFVQELLGRTGRIGFIARHP